VGPIRQLRRRVRIEDKKRESDETWASERAESALSSADTPNARDASDWDRCGST